MQFFYPIAGLDASMAYSRQPPLTTPDALNQRPFDVFEKRGRGGTRPGLDLAYNVQVGSGNPIRMAAIVHEFSNDNFDFWSDSFAGTALSSVWSTGQFSGTPTIEEINKTTCASVIGTTEKGAVAAASVVTDFSATTYRIEIFIPPVSGTHSGTYRLHARMDASSPVSSTDGVIAELTLSGATYSGSLKRYVGGVLTTNNFTGGTLAGVMPGWFILEVNSTNTIKCYWRDNLLLNQSGISAAVGQRFGFSLVGSSSTAKAAIDRFRVQYYRTSKFELLRPKLYVSSNGVLYRETWIDWLEAVSANPTIASGERVMATSLNNKLLIADWSEPLASGTDGTNTTTSFDSATYTDWTTLGIDTDDHSLHVVEGTSGANTTLDVGMHPITTVASGSLTLTHSPCPSGSAITFRVVRHPKKYDPKTNTLSAWRSTRFSAGTLSITDGVVTFSPSGSDKLPLWIEGRNLVADGKLYGISTRDSDTQFTLFDDTVNLTPTNWHIEKGKVPIGCRLMARHGGRIYLAGDPTAPQAWYASAEGDEDDWDYSIVDNDQAAVSGPTSNLSTVGEPITALCPWHRDLMMFGCRSSLWLLSGNPRNSGLQQISQKIGIVEAGAWCAGPQNELVFLSRDGLYITDTTCLSCEPKPLSRGLLPAELQSISERMVKVHMEYDVESQGICIELSHVNSRAGVSHWWFDLNSKTLWKQQYPATKEPTATVYVTSADAEEDGVLFCCRDGYVRRFRQCAENDEGTAISNYVWIGPFPLGAAPGYEGEWKTLQITLSPESGDATGALHVGRSPNEAFKASSRYSVAVGAGTGPVRWPKLKGAYGMMKLTGGSRPFAFESGDTETDATRSRTRG